MLVDGNDWAFEHPSKVVGLTYSRPDALQLVSQRGWTVAPEGVRWRRVVASPEPQAIVEIHTIRKLVADCTIVVCAGGGGIPVCRDADQRLRRVEALVDRDLTVALLAQELGADALLLLTDVDGVEPKIGTDSAQVMRRCTVEDLHAETFPPGPLGSKADAACRFVQATGMPAMIGTLGEAVEVLNGSKGMIVEPHRRQSLATQYRPRRPPPSSPIRTSV